MIDPDLEVNVADQFVSVDNDAVFRCQINAQTRHLFQVVGWLEDGQSIGQTSGNQFGWSKQQHRTLFLPDGQLYIQRVQLKDANKSYRCQIKNLLSGTITLSSLGGRLFVTGKLVKVGALVWEEKGKN